MTLDEEMNGIEAPNNQGVGGQAPVAPVAPAEAEAAPVEAAPVEAAPVEAAPEDLAPVSAAPLAEGAGVAEVRPIEDMPEALPGDAGAVGAPAEVSFSDEPSALFGGNAPQADVAAQQAQVNDPMAAQMPADITAPSANPPLESEDSGPNYPAPEKVAAEGEEEDPWGATITVNGTVYATSIFWQPLQNPDNPLPEVRETAENVLDNADLYVIRPSGMPQYGLGISSEGHRAGMPVAALSLVEAFSDVPSSVSVFKVPEGWWFIAVRNDLILSEEDMLYLNEEDAKRNFVSMMAVPDWGRRVAPASWQIDGTEERSIDEVLAKAPRVKLQKLKKELSIKTVSILVAAVVLIGWGAFSLLSYMFGSSEVIREVIAPPPVVKPVVEPPKEVVVPMPWEDLVVPGEFMKVCSDSTSLLVTATVPGWVIGDIKCQLTGLSTSWTMQWGRVGNFMAGMKRYNIDGLHYTVAAGGRSATGTIQFNNLRKAASAPTLTTQEITDDLTDIFQAVNIPVQLSVTEVKADAKSALGNNAGDFSYVNFGFSSALPVSEWNYFFDKFGALELTSLVYNTASNNWKYEGRIYGKKN